MRDLTPYPRWLLMAVCCLGGASQAQTTLFDPALGLPHLQGWLPVLIAPVTPGTVTLSATSVQLNTTADMGTQQGWLRLSPQPLDTVGGFTLAFSLLVDSTASSSTNRAGFSVLFVGNDPAHALELGFDSSSVFAYDYLPADPDRFVRGAGASFSAGVAHDYALQVAGQQFSLLIDGSAAFSGSLKNYQADGLPYTQANLMFFGDDTTRASSNVAIGAISLVSPVPEPASVAMWLLGLAGLAGTMSRRKRAG